MLGHQTLQLLPDILGLLEGSDLEEVVVCPRRALLVVLPGVVDVQQREVVSLGYPCLL